MSCVDFFLENFECYFWQRKLISLIIGLVSAILIFFVLGLVNPSWIICLVAPILIGFVFGTTYWVLTSESYCYGSSNPCVKEPKILIEA